MSSCSCTKTAAAVLAAREMVTAAFSSCKIERWSAALDRWSASAVDDPTCDQVRCVFYDKDEEECGLIRHGIHWQLSHEALQWLLRRRTFSGHEGD